VVLQGGPKVVALVTMRIPGAAGTGFVVDDDQGAKGGDRMGTEVIALPMETIVSANRRVRTVGAKVVDGEFRLGQGLVPKQQWESLVGGTKDTDEMVLGPPDLPFGSIGPVRTRWDVLDSKVAFLGKGFQQLGCLIV